jgi:hypothetical protein
MAVTAGLSLVFRRAKARCRRQGSDLMVTLQRDKLMNDRSPSLRNHHLGSPHTSRTMYRVIVVIQQTHVASLGKRAMRAGSTPYTRQPPTETEHARYAMADALKDAKLSAPLGRAFHADEGVNML